MYLKSNEVCTIIKNAYGQYVELLKLVKAAFWVWVLVSKQDQPQYSYATWLYEEPG
jgi:hypothetical protein